MAKFSQAMKRKESQFLGENTKQPTSGNTSSPLLSPLKTGQSKTNPLQATALPATPSAPAAPTFTQIKKRLGKGINAKLK